MCGTAWHSHLGWKPQPETGQLPSGLYGKANRLEGRPDCRNRSKGQCPPTARAISAFPTQSDVSVVRPTWVPRSHVPPCSVARNYDTASTHKHRGRRRAHGPRGQPGKARAAHKLAQTPGGR